jgi:hypothetical protein
MMLGIIADPFTVDLTTVTGQVLASVSSAVNLYSGELVVGTNVPSGTLIADVDSNANTVFLSEKALTTETKTVTISDPNVWSKVRIGWQIEGQPGFPIDVNTTIVRCTPDEDGYSQTRDITRTDNDDDTISETDVFTRCWRTFWTFIGPNSVDRARAVRSALMKIQFVADNLAESNVYLIPDIPEPRRVPRNFQGQWWETVDMEVRFYEQVNEVSTTGTVASVEVTVYDKDGQLTDFTVTLP